MGQQLGVSVARIHEIQPHRGEHVTCWFDNLLPDSRQIRKRVRQRFRLDSSDPFDLLAAIGRDCVGAVQLLPTGFEPPTARRIEAERLTDQDVAELLRRVPSVERLGERTPEEAFRLSIAGAQAKTALLQRDGVWYRPTGATPTTHILKLPLGLVGNVGADLRNSVENEWLCLQLLHELGLPVPSAAIASCKTPPMAPSGLSASHRRTCVRPRVRHRVPCRRRSRA